MKKTTPTMKDVAQEAGVALGTVSKVFNGIPVGERYRTKVEQAAKKLGYEVNQYARGLRAGTTATVALILPDVINPFFSRLAQGVCTALAQQGYKMVLSLTANDTEAEENCIRMVMQNKVDGIISLTYYPGAAIEYHLPCVSIDRILNPHIPCVSSDNFGGGQLAAGKLLELGCRHPLFLRIGSKVPGEADKRGDGFESVLRQKGIPCESLLLNDEDGMTPFYDFLRSHIRDGALAFDGIFCVNDALAIHIWNYLKDLGLRVPEDVQIIGFDGMRHFATNEFHCSTIVQSVGRLAETCVELLLRPNRSNLPSLVCLPVTYAPGGTTREPIHGPKEETGHEDRT